MPGAPGASPLQAAGEGPAVRQCGAGAPFNPSMDPIEQRFPQVGRPARPTPPLPPAASSAALRCAATGRPRLLQPAAALQAPWLPPDTVKRELQGAVPIGEGRIGRVW